MSNLKPYTLFPLILTALVGCSGCGGSSVQMVGNGATFPETIYSQWFSDFSKKNPEYQVTYTGVGSGQGVQNIIDEVGEFGASDVAMKPEEVEKVKRGRGNAPVNRRRDCTGLQSSR